MATPAQSLDQLPTVPHWINGRRCVTESERSGEVFNPATGQVESRVGFASSIDSDAAIDAAANAFEPWANTPVVQRARVMFRYKALLESHRDELAKLISREHGKVIDDAAGSIQRGIENVEFACGLPQLLKGEFSEQVGTGVDVWSLRQPLGICAGITPFNFPVMVPLWMFPIAITCGNTFILKPSEKDPSASVLLAELLHEAGAPAGVLNVLQGDKTTVDLLLKDPRISAISFVGSTPVAESIYRIATDCGKRVQALGGAKNHMVVLPDADLDQAADALVSSAYGSAGERCMAISVGVVVGQIGDALIDKLKDKIGAIKLGAYSDPNADMGPLITPEHRDRVESYIDEGVKEGAELVIDGRGTRVRGHEDGHFVGPTLFDRARPDMRIYTDEIFGPVLTIVRADSFDDAIGLVNDHEYGNGTAIFTRDGDAAREFAARVDIGMVGINVPIPVPMAFYSFGGWKRSLFGDMAIYGPEGVRFYSRVKTVTSRWPTGIRAGVDLQFPTNK